MGWTDGCNYSCSLNFLACPTRGYEHVSMSLQPCLGVLVILFFSALHLGGIWLRSHNVSVPRGVSPPNSPRLTFRLNNLFSPGRVSAEEEEEMGGCFGCGIMFHRSFGGATHTGAGVALENFIFLTPVLAKSLEQLFF